MKKDKFKLKYITEQAMKEKEEEIPLSKDQKKQFLEQVKLYNSYRNKLHTESDLVKIAEELSFLSKMAERITLEETDDWFDKVTISRNMKELKRINEEFNKTTKEAKSVQQRMMSLYEDMGHIIKRYFSVDPDENNLNESAAPSSILLDFKKWFNSFKKQRAGYMDNFKNNKFGMYLDYQGYTFNVKYDSKKNKWLIINSNKK